MSHLRRQHRKLASALSFCESINRKIDEQVGGARGAAGSGQARPAGLQMPGYLLAAVWRCVEVAGPLVSYEVCIAMDQRM